MAKAKKEKTEEDQIDQIEAILDDKQFKTLHLGSRSGTEIIKPQIITTGSFYFDQVIGGGFRSSSWSRFYADPESGKTSQGLCWAKNWQNHYGEQGFVVVFNAEGRVTADLIARSGIDTSKSRFRIVDTNNADFIYTMMEKLITENTNDFRYFFIVDSTDACQRSVDKDKNLGEAEKIGGTATILSAAGKRLSILFALKEHHLYMTSQVRDKINTHGPAGGGKDASGGNAPKFYSSLTGLIQKHWSEHSILESGDPKSREIGRIINIKLAKTYNESTGQIVQFPVKYGHKGGIWREYEAQMMLEEYKLVKKSGAWYEFDENYIETLKGAGITLDQVKFQGSAQLRGAFEANPDLVDYVHKTFREKLLS